MTTVSGRSPSGRATHEPSQSLLSRPTVSVPNAQRLYALPRDEWAAYTNLGCGKLPKAKNASEPYIYTDGPSPVPDGTPISIWYADRRSSHSGWWIGSTASQNMFSKPCIFRLRNVPAQVPQSATDELERERAFWRGYCAGSDAMQSVLVTVLERLAPASAIEARRAATVEQGAVHESAGPQDDAQGEPA